MRRTRIELLIVGVAALALGAGIVGGLLVAKLPSANASNTHPPRGGDRSPLGDELDLSATQREQMREIWEGVRGQVHETFDKAKALERRREEALIGLLTDAQKEKFEQLASGFAMEFDTLRQDRDRVFESAVEKTKQLLNEQQRGKYEEILRTRGPGALGPGGPPFPPKNLEKDERSRKNPTPGPS